MTNPHPTTPTAIDIRVTADRVIAQLREGNLAEGLASLEEARGSQRPVVQEALDRYVAAEILMDTGALDRFGDQRTEHAIVVTRLERALGPPRIPDYSNVANAPNELVGLTEAQKHHIYASMVQARGNESARQDLRRDNHSVLLGLRRETSTLASTDGGRTGTGLYDDQIVVLTRTAHGDERIFIGGRASTEPTAQYAHQAGSDGNRPFSGGLREHRRIAPAAGYGEVVWRKIEGEDADGDTMLDLGQLSEGTIEMAKADHPNPRSVATRDAFRPSHDQLEPARTAGLVQRDTNGDGYFTVTDVHGIQDLNRSFKIHSGSRHNTDSAGCQTIHPDDYRAFINAAQSNPRQTRWQYVLTSTQGGLFHNVEVGREPAPAAPPQAPRPAPAERPMDYRGDISQPSGPFEDLGLNRYYAAVLAGDSAMADSIAFGFSFRAPEVAAQAAGHEQQMASAQREAPNLQM